MQERTRAARFPRRRTARTRPRTTGWRWSPRPPQQTWIATAYRFCAILSDRLNFFRSLLDLFEAVALTHFSHGPGIVSPWSGTFRLHPTSRGDAYALLCTGIRFLLFTVASQHAFCRPRPLDSRGGRPAHAGTSSRSESIGSAQAALAPWASGRAAALETLGGFVLLRSRRRAMNRGARARRGVFVL